MSAVLLLFLNLLFIIFHVLYCILTDYWKHVSHSRWQLIEIVDLLTVIQSFWNGKVLLLVGMISGSFWLWSWSWSWFCKIVLFTYASLLVTCLVTYPWFVIDVNTVYNITEWALGSVLDCLLRCNGINVNWVSVITTLILNWGKCVCIFWLDVVHVLMDVLADFIETSLIIITMTFMSF